MDREVEEKLLEDITSAMERLVGAAESLRLATSASRRGSRSWLRPS